MSPKYRTHRRGTQARLLTACFGKSVGFSAEILRCLEMLMRSDAGTGLMHESFHKDNPQRYTRPWFAWQNTLFGELVLHLIDEGKVDLLLKAHR